MKLRHSLLAISFLLSFGLFAQNLEKKYQQGINSTKALKRVEAKSIFTEIIEKDPSFAKAYFQRGLINAYYKEYEEAVKDFKQVTKIEKDFFLEAHLEMGKIKDEHLKDYEGAVVDFTVILSKDKKNAEAYYRRGKCKYELEQYESAIADFHSGLKIDSDNIDLIYYRGLTEIELERYESAIAAFTYVIEKKPKWADPYFYRAYAHYQEANNKDFKHHKQLFQSSLEDYDTALKLDPNIEEAYFDRGEVKMALHDYIGAIADFKKAINLKPRDVEAHYQKAMCNYHYGYEDIALSEFEDILKMDSAYVDAAYQIGVIKYEKENLEEAVEAFEQVLVFDKEHADVYFYLGLTYYDLKQTAKACENWKIADKLGDKESHHYITTKCK